MYIHGIYFTIKPAADKAKKYYLKTLQKNDFILTFKVCYDTIRSVRVQYNKTESLDVKNSGGDILWTSARR